MPTAMKTIAGVGSSKEGLLMEAGAGFHGPGVVWRSTEEAVKRRRDARRDAELGEKTMEQHPDSPSCPLSPSFTINDFRVIWEILRFGEYFSTQSFVSDSSVTSFSPQPWPLVQIASFHTSCTGTSAHGSPDNCLFQGQSFPSPAPGCASIPTPYPANHNEV